MWIYEKRKRDGREEGGERRREKEIGWAKGEREGGEMFIYEKRKQDGKEEVRERRREKEIL